MIALQRSVKDRNNPIAQQKVDDRRDVRKAMRQPTAASNEREPDTSSVSDPKAEASRTMSDTAVSSDDLSEFRSAFFEECGDMLVSIDTQLSGADTCLPGVAALNDVFRAVHTIKGAAGFFNLEAVGQFAHTFEALLGAAREGRIGDKDGLGRLLVEGADVLATIIDRSRDGMSPPQGLGQDVASRIEAFLNGSEASPASPESTAVAKDHVAADAPARHLLLRVRMLGANPEAHALHARILAELGRLGAAQLKTGPSVDPTSPCTWDVELITRHDDDAVRGVFAFVDHELDIVSVADQAPISDAPGLEMPHEERSEKPASAPGKGKTAVTTIRVDLARIDRLVNMVGELVITQAMLTQQINDQSGGNKHQLRQGHEDLANYTRELQECVMAIRMQPVRSVFARIPRLVREISSKLGKKVRLEMSGEQTEIDKTVIEELADPLLHMIRNAIDHGIESIEKRRAVGKPDEGLIELSAAQRGGNILITLTDDGAGIDRTRVRAKAIERGIINPDAALSGEEIDQLIFAPGFSTAEKVTDVSGRGVGMDVVLSNISNLGACRPIGVFLSSPRSSAP